MNSSHLQSKSFLLSAAVVSGIILYIYRDSRQARKNQASQHRTQKRNDSLLQKRLGNYTYCCFQ